MRRPARFARSSPPSVPRWGRPRRLRRRLRSLLVVASSSCAVAARRPTGSDGSSGFLSFMAGGGLCHSFTSCDDPLASLAPAPLPSPGGGDLAASGADSAPCSSSQAPPAPSLRDVRRGRTARVDFSRLWRAAGFAIASLHATTRSLRSLQPPFRPPVGETSPPPAPTPLLARRRKLLLRRRCATSDGVGRLEWISLVYGGRRALP